MPGPVDVILIRFANQDFHSLLATALAEVIGKGLARVDDLVFLHKDTQGNVTTIEVDEVAEGAFADVQGEYGGLISDSDLLAESDQLEPGTSAAVVVLEHLWPQALQDAVRAADGTVLSVERIPTDTVVAAFAAAQDD